MLSTNRAKVTVTFGQLEQLLGHDLPLTAHSSSSWWTHFHDHAEAWRLQRAGWLVDAVYPQAHLVTLVAEYAPGR